MDVISLRRDNQWPLDASNHVYMTSTGSGTFWQHPAGSQDVQNALNRARWAGGIRRFLEPLVSLWGGSGLPGLGRVLDGPVRP